VTAQLLVCHIQYVSNVYAHATRPHVCDAASLYKLSSPAAYSMHSSLPSALRSVKPRLGLPQIVPFAVATFTIAHLVLPHVYTD